MKKRNLNLFFFLWLALSLNTSLWAQNRLISGTVLSNEDTQPLVGVSVAVKGTLLGTQTDLDGKFNLQVPVENTKLVLTYVGFTPLEVDIKDRTELEITLSSDTRQLGEVVISGYSSQSKKVFTGAASQIKAEQLENRPAQSFDQLLGGQAAGVNIIQPSGVLNNTPVFRIRGINSISSGIYPLIIVDGVAVFTGLVGGTIGNNPLADLNPSDIESIDILKDASATAIYGSRAANGVVVITTKKGKQGKVKVNYDGWLSFSKPFNLLPLLNANDYVTIKNEAMANAGRTPGYALQTLPDGRTVSTDWYDVAYQTGVSQNHNVSFSGASPGTQYFVSVAYSNQEGIIKTNTFEHKVVRLNLNHELLKNVNVGTNVSYSNSYNAGPNTGSLPGQYITTAALSRMTYVLPPNVGAYKADGTYNIEDLVRVGYGANNNNPASPGFVGTINAYNLQLILDLDKYTSESNSLVGNVFAEWFLWKDLKLKTSYGLNQLNVENTGFQNPFHGDSGPSGGIATNRNSKYNRSDWVTTLNYNKSFGGLHNLTVLLGYEEIKTTINAWGATRTGITDPFFTSYQGGWANIAASGTTQGANGFVSYFSNLNYDFNRKYLFSLSYRRDGYSGLPENSRFGDFIGGSIGWNLSEENFFKNTGLGDLFSNFKLRASYGQVGNINIGDFPSLGLYSASTYYGLATLGFSQAGNANLQWETSTKTDFGLSVSLLKGRISLEADYYKSVIDGLVLDARQAPSRGIPNNSISANVGSMYNQGIELGLNVQVIQKGDFNWDANLNFSTLENKVTKLFSGNDIYIPSIFGIQNLTREGYSVGSIFAVPSPGVNPANGYRIFINSKGEEVQYNHAGANRWTYVKDGAAAPAINNYTDGRIQGSSLPTYYGGFNNTLSYKAFDLNIGIIFSGGNKIYNGARSNLLDQRYFNNGTFVLDRWTAPGQVTDIPKLIYGDNVSTGFSITNSDCVEDGSFVKLKNLSLGYRLPVQALTKNRISSARIYVQGANLITWTKYRGSDPEISINGNSIDSGKDHNSVVNAQVFTVGLNVGF